MARLLVMLLLPLVLLEECYGKALFAADSNLSLLIMRRR